MKNLILILLFLSLGSQAACLQDSLLLNTKAVGDIRKVEAAVETFREAMVNEIPKNHSLVIRLESLNPRVNADIIKVENELVIQVLGGMLKHEAMSPEALLLLLCHEIGHFLGGSPTKSREGWSSTEGQSDYFSGIRCARILGLDEASFIDAALALTGIYAQVGNALPPKLDQCDERTVERTNFGYPGAQCRLDTLMAGWLGRERPRCWFYE